MRNASERLAKLTGKEADPRDVGRWLLDREIKGTEDEQRALIRSAIEKSRSNASELLGASTKKYDTKTVKKAQEALGEILTRYSKKSGDDIVPTVGNEEVFNEMVGLIGKKGLTLKELNEARRIIADSGDIFRKTGEMAESASKK